MSEPTESREQVLEAIKVLARDKLDWTGRMEPGMRLVEDLKLDSIRLLTLAMEVEDRFRIFLDEDEESRIQTVDDLIDVILTKQRYQNGNQDADQNDGL